MSITKVSNAEILERVHTAGLQLIWSHPVIGSVYMQAKGLFLVDDTPVNVMHRGRAIAISPTWNIDDQGLVRMGSEFTAPLSSPEIQFLIAHELMHNLLEHGARAERLGLVIDQHIAPGQEENFGAWGRATDRAINYALTQDKIGQMPKGGLLPLPDYSGPMDAESLYYYEIQQTPPPPPPDGGTPPPGQGCAPKGAPGQGDPSEGQGDPSEGPGQGTPGQAPGQTPGQAPPPEIDWSQARRDMEALVAQLGIGQGTSALAQLLNPPPARTDYKAVIRAGYERASLEATNRTQPTYSRAGRREGLIDGLILPGKQGTESSIAVVIDVSGSVSRKLVEKIISEVLKLGKDFPDVRPYVVTHTSEVCWEGWIRPGDTKALNEATSFTGGTDANPAYEACAKVANSPAVPGRRFDALVHFTDCELFGAWPDASCARQLIVGACGLGGSSPHCEPPKGTKMIPVEERA